MVNPVSDSSNQLIAPLNESSKHKDLFQKKGNSPQINVSLSEKALELKVFQSDNQRISVLKKEFNEVFEFGVDKKDSFLKKLDQILVNNRL